ncbi:MAG: SCO1664 family protein [Chloroflexaceae bacterium]|nr:SCO1664 family protein [Chloroflexaceae bacterium]
MSLAETHDIRVLEALRYGDILVEGMLPYSSNFTLLAWVEHEGIGTHAVYKPRRGERPLWDFPQGTLCFREVAAYLVSEAVGFGLVPPTVIRDGPHGVGAIQLFIDHDPEEHLLTMHGAGGYESDILRLAAFDYLVNNADRKSGHCLKGEDGRLWAIDHGICFHEEYKLRTVLWDFIGQPFPPDVLHALRALRQRIQNPRTPDLKRTLKHLLMASEVRALVQRLEYMIATGIYPRPGNGPAIPWPPV